MRFQIVKNFVAKLFKIQVIKQYTGKVSKEEFEKRYFTKIKDKDNTGFIISIVSVLFFLGLLFYGFLQLLSLQNIINVEPVIYDPPEILEAFYAHFGTLGSSALLPVFNIDNDKNISYDVQIVASDHPIIKEFYLLKSGGEQYENAMYELTQYMDYKFRIIEPEQIDSLPNGAFVLHFGQVLDKKVYDVIQNSNKKLNFIFISSRLPAFYKPDPLSSPISHNLFVFPLIQNKKSEKNPIIAYILGSSSFRVNYMIPDSAVFDFLSYFYDEGRSKLYLFYPVDLNDEILESVEKAYEILKLHLENGAWINGISGPRSTTSINPGHRFLVINLDKIRPNVYIRSIDPYKPFLLVSNIYPFSRGAVLAKDRFFLPKTEQAFDVRYEPYGLRTERRNLELILYNVSNSKLASFAVGNIEPKISTEYRRSLNLEEGTYMIELRETTGVLLSRSIVVASSVYPKAQYFDNRQGRFLKIYFYSFDGSPVYVDNVKFKLPWEEKIREERFVDSSGITINLDQPLPVGNYTITFNIKNIEYQATFRVLPRTSIDRLILGNPLGLATIVISVLIVFGSNFLKPRPPITYSIDIPDVFPPIDTQEYRLDEDKLRKLFEYVESYYKWKYVPLTEKEISEGLSSIDINLETGVIDYNSLSVTLNTYVLRGVLKKYRDYYILADWESKSGLNVEQLVMYRILRDTGLEYGILYELDLQKESAVKYISEYGEGIVYLYDSSKVNSIFKSILDALNQYGEVIVITKDYFDLKDLQSQLYSNNLGMMIIQYVRNDKVQLITLDEYLEKIKLF